MFQTLVFIYYLIGLLLVIGFFKKSKLGKPFVMSKLSGQISFNKKIDDIKSYEKSFQFWCYIGLLSSQWVLFIFLLVIYYSSRMITTSENHGWLNNPTLLNVTIHKTTTFIIALLTLFVIINYMHLGIPLSKIIINNFFNIKQ
jgi:hypothetical protein